MKDQLIINSLRMLSIDAVQAANSGHPGLPLGAAPMAYTIWNRFMNTNPKQSEWINRDRFVLSAGHGSALLYSLLHVHGFDVSIEDIKNFRQIDSKTPGHPEFGHTEGVDATTGPLGQGLSMAVGMAMAEAHLNAVFEKDGESLIDHYTYVLCSDGDLMEGVTNEASSLAGTLKLKKLIVVYDSNQISIEGSTDLAFNENVLKRYDALGWHTLTVEDGNDVEAIAKAIEEAKQADKPSMIEVKTQIGYGSPRVGLAKAHGEPLGNDLVTETRGYFKWEHEAFALPEEVGVYRDEYILRGEKAYQEWEEKKQKFFEDEEYKNLYDQYFGDANPKLEALQFEKAMASRESASVVLQEVAKHYPNLFGGSADLGPSNKSVMNDRDTFSAENYAGSNVHFGIREFAMTAALNGMALHGGLKPYGATFLVFSDYMKPAMRLAALMGQQVFYILTHDSIGVGEDGPTHQPIEHLAMLRSIPNMTVFRPADGIEAQMAWEYALGHTDGPTAFVLSRQKMPLQENTGDGAKKGAYIIDDVENPDVLLLSTGTEVHLAQEAAKTLKEDGIAARVISMPSFEVFEKQDEEYKESILPKGMKRVAVEAATSFGWHKYIGFDGGFIGIDTFGASGPGDAVYEKFDITADAVVQEVKRVLEK